MTALLATTEAPALSALLALDTILLCATAALLIGRRRALLPRLLGLTPSPLSPSRLAPGELFLAAVFAFGGAILLQFAAIYAGKRWFPAPADGGFGLYHVAAAAAFQIGLLAGLGHAWFWHLRPSRRAPDAAPTASRPAPQPVPVSRILRGGVVTFIVALFAVGPASLAWQAVLDLLGVDAPPQDLISLFTRAGDLSSLAVMVFLAIIVAPFTEEWVFRIGLFCWLRDRAPRGVALFLPAILFAAVHGNLAVFMPLAVLAVVLALGYEHYGHPAVPILAHALFNLNTVALLLSGFPA